MFLAWRKLGKLPSESVSGLFSRTKGLGEAIARCTWEDVVATMASKAVIPRFLLPLQSPLWRGVRIPLSSSIGVRYASSGKPDKTIVLEKPAKFNPPSHGSRLKRNTLPKHYGPQLTPIDIARQNAKHYPTLMAPEGSWAHWFWHARTLHTVITMVRLSNSLRMARN